VTKNASCGSSTTETLPPTMSKELLRQAGVAPTYFLMTSPQHSSSSSDAVDALLSLRFFDGGSLNLDFGLSISSSESLILSEIEGICCREAGDRASFLDASG